MFSLLKKIAPEYEVQILKLEDGLKPISDIGFYFLDRFICMERNLLVEVPQTNVPGLFWQAGIPENGGGVEQIKALAKSVFLTDRRFHIEPDFNQAAANKRIETYIDLCINDGAEIFHCKGQNDALLGFTILKRIDDNTYLNCLSATEPSVVGMLAANVVYNSTAAALKARGCHKIIGYVSSTNKDSLNLHSKIGCKVIDIVDVWVKNK